MAYLGKTYNSERHEKFDEFLASLRVPQEQIDEILSKKTSLTLVKNGDTYTQTVMSQPVSFQSGVEFDETVGEHKCKTTCTVEGDTLTQTQKFQDGLIITFKKKFSGDKLVVEATNSAWDGVAYRYYSA